MSHPETSRPGLLLAAFPPELGDLAEHPPEGWITGCVGIGVACAAVGTARLIAAHAPSRVLFIGTCGAYDPCLKIGDCISVTEVLATSLEEIREVAYRPAIERTLWKGDLPLPFPPHVVATPPAITRSPEGAQALATMAEVEHLELSGVFEAARAAGIPVGAVLGVANRVGPDAHEEWSSHHVEVSRHLIGQLRERGVLG
ncbi:phosphorylase [Holophaga foetida]|uniref:5'-methylthioadenosine/S-adenosylhomocysteine nucleosidase family protein n=1 Tax=Holophaga foetida TaxID=35839 RepID=UPI0002473F1B|nr:phosphorylase [Holophaga foetida]